MNHTTSELAPLVAAALTGLIAYGRMAGSPDPEEMHERMLNLAEEAVDIAVLTADALSNHQNLVPK